MPSANQQVSGGKGSIGSLTATAQVGALGTATASQNAQRADAPVTRAALREMRVAAQPFPDVPVLVLSAARGFPRRFRAQWTRLQAGLAADAPRDAMSSSTAPAMTSPGDRPDVVAGAILATAAQVPPVSG